MKHDDAHLHARGAAHYVRDIPAPQGTLHAVAVPSPVAHGRLRKIETAAAAAAPGVVAVLTARDIPGQNQIGSIIQDEPLARRGRSRIHRPAGGPDHRRKRCGRPRRQGPDQARHRAASGRVRPAPSLCPRLSHRPRPHLRHGRRGRGLAALPRRGRRPGRHRRPGAHVSGDAIGAGRPARRRRIESLFRDPIPHRGPARHRPRPGAGHAPGGGRRAAPGRRLRRQGRPGHGLGRTGRTGRVPAGQARQARLEPPRGRVLHGQAPPLLLRTTRSGWPKTAEYWPTRRPSIRTRAPARISPPPSWSARCSTPPTATSSPT